MAGQQIDRDKLRAALRKLRPEDLFHMLEEAITLLPQEQLLGLAKPHLNVSTLDGGWQTQGWICSGK
jgi:hypothetical protein